MLCTDTVIIGAGHAGLAMSRCLAERDVDHVVLERGRVGDRWRTARWDGFRLLTPNWLSRLPGWAYAGCDPDGFMTAAEFVDYLSAYARSFGAPVRAGTTVVRVEPADSGFTVLTDHGGWSARNVVIATGYHSRPQIPGLAGRLPKDLVQLTPATFKSSAALPDGGVLVVGASASGVQLAQELARSGRAVHLAVGRHTRLPRRYRGRDILWWLDSIGLLDRTVDQMSGIEAARAEPSLQLVGTSCPRGVDLGVLRAAGVRLTGRLYAMDGAVASFADDLEDTVTAAEHRLSRMLGEIDRYADSLQAPPPERPEAVVVNRSPSRIDLHRAGIRTVVWATGFRPRYPWLAAPVLDADGHIEHRRGVTGLPGLYAIGLRFQYRRTSTFVDGARHDAAYLADHIVASRARR